MTDLGSAQEARPLFYRPLHRHKVDIVHQNIHKGNKKGD